MKKNNHGGQRKNAGRKKSGKERLKFWTFPELKPIIEEFIKTKEAQIKK